MQQPKDIVRSLVSGARNHLSQQVVGRAVQGDWQGAGQKLAGFPKAYGEGMSVGRLGPQKQLAEQVGSRIMQEPKLVVRGKLMDLYGRLTSKKPFPTDVTKAKDYLGGKKADLDPMFKVEELPSDLPK